MAALLLFGAGGAAQRAAADPAETALAGRTLSAVAYLGRPEARAHSELTRIMFQAYLGGDGRAVVRVWDPARNAYTPPAAAGWSLRGSKFCLDAVSGAGRLCADIHIWGPRIAGIEADPYVMLDGDLAPGNAVFAGRQ